MNALAFPSMQSTTARANKLINNKAFLVLKQSKKHWRKHLMTSKHKVTEMKHLTPYRQNETFLSPVRGRGMVYEDGMIKEFPQKT